MKKLGSPSLFSALVISLLSSIFPTAASAGSQAEPITVFVAKKIITMEPGWSEAPAVAVRAGKILSVGTMEELKPWLDSAPYTVDRTFADKVLMPGFIEPHGHPIVGGTALTRPLLTYIPEPNPYGKPFPGVKNKEEALAKLKEYASELKSPDDPLIAWGYDRTAMGAQLDKNILDTVSSTRPIIVWEASEHFVYANTPAMKRYGITRADAKIPGVMVGADGEPNGQFLGVQAADRIMEEPMKALVTPDVALKNVKYLMDLSREHGITTTSEMAMGLVDPQLEMFVLDKYFNNADNPVRLVSVTDGATMTKLKGDKAIEFVSQLPARNTEKLMFNGVKFFADDAFLSMGMAIENPGYVDGHKGLYNTPPDAMVPNWLPWWKAGFHIHVHTNGNGGNQATINALQGLMNAYPRTDHRFTFEHFGISTPELVRHVKVLGGVVSINPYYVYHRSELTAPHIGSDRAYTAARLKTLVDAGVITSLHTDTPVAPPNPLEEVWIAVNRFGLSGTVRAPEERISLDKALKMVTCDAAYTLGVEDKVGSIAPGKFADFAVLEEDPYAVAKERIRDIKVWGTVFGGKVYPASQIKP